MLKIAFHPLYTHPLPERHRFPMIKYTLLRQQLIDDGVVEKEAFFQPTLVEPHILHAAHATDYVQHLLELTLDPKMVRRIGFTLSSQLIDRERSLVKGTICGAEYAQQHGVAFNIAGGTHHAGHDYGEGFCLLNDQAVAAAYLLDQQKSKRILIIDLDVHQGNGTAHIFKNEPRVYTLSIHSQNNYPFQKEQSDRDIGLPDNTDDNTYLTVLDATLESVFDDFKPDFVFYQAGVDVLATDKLGKLALTLEGCQLRDERVFEACRQRQLPVQVSMGGGYSPNVRDIVHAHVNTFKTAIKIFNFS